MTTRQVTASEREFFERKYPYLADFSAVIFNSGVSPNMPTPQADRNPLLPTPVVAATPMVRPGDEDATENTPAQQRTTIESTPYPDDAESEVLPEIEDYLYDEFADGIFPEFVPFPAQKDDD